MLDPDVDGKFVDLPFESWNWFISSAWTSSHFEFLRVWVWRRVCWFLDRIFQTFQVLSSSSFSKIQNIELEFLQVWNLSFKTCRVFKFPVARSSTIDYICISFTSVWMPCWWIQNLAWILPIWNSVMSKHLT